MFNSDFVFFLHLEPENAALELLEAPHNQLDIVSKVESTIETFKVYLSISDNVKNLYSRAAGTSGTF